MVNPKTTAAGYLAVGTALVGLLGAIGALCTGQAWCLYVGAIGTALSNVLNGVGNIASEDGRH